MSEEGTAFFIGLFLGAFVMAVIVSKCSKDHWQERLIEENCAEWRIDPKTGNSYFKTFPRTKDELHQISNR